MSFRRFLYLVADDLVDRSYSSLRRIDMSRLFFGRSTEGALLDSTGGGAGATDPSAIEVACGLPEPTLSLGAPPKSKHKNGSIDFVPFKTKGNDGENLKLVSMDQTCRTLLCDPSGAPPSVLALPRLVTPKFRPFSLTVGGSLYVMESFPEPPNGRMRHSFEALSYGNPTGELLGREVWHWRSLQPPPYVYEGPRDHSRYIESYAVVGGTDILVSNKAGRTYRFDTTAGGTWSKAGDWPLPFSFLAEYVPEHGLWFGLSPMEDGYRFSAADLTPASALAADSSSPPPVHGSWQEYGKPPPEWNLERCFAVHLGSAKFCIVRFFVIGGLSLYPDSHHIEEELQAVLTGVEVERGGGGELRVVKHKSERYKLDPDVYYWVV